MKYIKAAIRLTAIFAALLYMSVYISVAQTVPSNFDVLDSLIKLNAEDIVKDIDERGIDSFTLEIHEHPADWLLRQHVVSSAAARDIKITESDSMPGRPIVKPAIKNIKIEYANLAGDDDRVSRRISSSVSAIISGQGGLSDLPSEVYSRSDTLIRAQARLAAETPYGFAKGEIPNPPESFFDKYIVPVVVVSSAAVTAFLLFTVRSK
jgi:hypothetical protein